MNRDNDPFQDVDQLETPDVWSDVEARAARADRSVSVPDGRAGSRFAAIVVAFLVFMAGSALLFRAVVTGPDDQTAITDPSDPVPVEPVSVDPWGWLEPGLNELPPLPGPRFGFAKVWTGTEFLVWGGTLNFDGPGLDDGYALAAETGQWSALPDGPLKGRQGPIAVWSGEEMVVLGGTDEPGSYLDDSAAYDPATRTWRSIPTSPIPLFRAVGVWADGEVIVWASRDNRTAALDPATGEWRGLVQAPYPLDRVPQAIWTGTAMIVVGELDEGPHEDLSTRGLSFDVASNTWAELPVSDLAEEATEIVWSGDRVLGVDYAHLVQSYAPGAKRWQTETEVPLKSGEGWPGAIAISGNDLYVDAVGGQAIWDSESGSWTELPALRGSDGWTVPVAAGDAIVIIPAFPTDAVEQTWVWRTSD